MTARPVQRPSLAIPSRLPTGFWRVLLAAAALWLAYISGKDLATGVDFKLFLLWMAFFTAFVFLNPRLGLYAFCFTLILVPYSWRLAGFRFSAPNTMVIGGALLALAGSLALRRTPVIHSRIYPFVGLAVAVAWVNFARYGRGFFNVPYILTEALVPFLLGLHLIRTRIHLGELLTALGVAFVARNVIDVTLTIVSVLAGDPLGLLPRDRIPFGGTVTTESEWRVMLLPLFIITVLLSRERRFKTLYGAALMLDLIWLSLAGTRTALLGLVLASLSALVVLHGGERRRLVRLLAPAAVIVVFMAAVFSQSWLHILEKTRHDLQRGFTGGRAALWYEALMAFWQSPLVGSGPGPSHSYVLGTGRSMGLAFLLPFGIAMVAVWRHGAWVRAQPVDLRIRAFVSGVQAGLLVAIPLNLAGRMFQGAVPAMFFWLLVGVQEAIYLDLRSGRYAIVAPPRPMPGPSSWSLRARAPGPAP